MTLGRKPSFPKAKAEVRVERGKPRLYVNGGEVYPLMALSIRLLETVSSYRRARIRLLAPLIGFDNVWLGPGHYEWGLPDEYFSMLISFHSQAFFLPRLHLYAPPWWKNSHPDELVQYGLPFEPELYRTDGRFLRAV